MSAKDYPITTPYGQVAGYPLNNGFHKGIDYGCPVGTPVVVNGVTIGLSGNTGASTGPHLHVGRWVGGKVTNPGGGGFTFNSAVVTEINEDSTDGKYVRVEGDGASWVYLHLSNNQLVKVGQVLKGDVMDDEDKKDVYRLGLHREPESLVAAQSLPSKFSDASDTIRKSSEWLTQNDVLLRAYPALVAHAAELEKELADSGSDKSKQILADMQAVIKKYGG